VVCNKIRNAILGSQKTADGTAPAVYLDLMPLFLAETKTGTPSSIGSID